MAETGEDKLSASDGNTSQIERLERDLAREHNLYLRALADFENYRRRVERDRAGAARSGKREIISPLLEVLDGFERALQHVDDAPAAMTEGWRALERQLLRLLEAQGIVPFESIGRRFDPTLHDAIGMVESDEVESGAVAQELQRGYRWGDEVLRPARVRVAK